MQLASTSTPNNTRTDRHTVSRTPLMLSVDCRAEQCREPADQRCVRGDSPFEQGIAGWRFKTQAGRRRRALPDATVADNCLAADQLVDRAVDDRSNDTTGNRLAKSCLTAHLDRDALVPQH